MIPGSDTHLAAPSVWSSRENCAETCMNGRMTFLFAALAALGPPRAFGGQADEDVKALVSKFTELKEPDFGLSSTMSGTRFAPVPNSGRFGSGLLTHHGLKESGPLKKVVE